MKTTMILVLALSVLAGCKDDKPNADDIEQGYLNGIETTKQLPLLNMDQWKICPLAYNSRCGCALRTSS